MADDPWDLEIRPKMSYARFGLEGGAQTSLLPRIIPVFPKVWSLKFVRLETLNWLRRKATEAKDLYGETVRTWSVKPEIEKLSPRLDKFGNLSIAVVVKRGASRKGKLSPGEIYALVDRGTKPHRITPKGTRTKKVNTVHGTLYVAQSGAPMLRFRGYFTAKTTPGGITSGLGHRGDRWYSRPEVIQSIEPREFSVTIADYMTGIMAAEIGSIVKTGLRKGGAIK